MAVLSTADRNRVARLWARTVYVPNGGGVGITATLTQAQIRTAVDNLDNAFETTANTGASTVAQFLNTSLGATFNNATTVAQRATLLNCLALIKWGGDLVSGS